LKKSILALCAFSLAASLAACGGGTSSYTVGGTVSGLQYGPLVLLTNGMEVSLQPKPDASGNPTVITYAFPKQLDYGEAYAVTLKKIGTDSSGNPTYQQPPHQVCGPSSDPTSRTAETAGRLSVINASFVCDLASHAIGGTIEGLTADGLKLTNGSNPNIVVAAKDTTTGAYPTIFLFPDPVVYNQSYGVTVLEQPTGQTCTVSNGSGIMGDDPIGTIAVKCVAKPT